ncbi:MAG: P1 family peptidase [Actinobacteria bacterium]|nr:P1 family peptidase [Actinomycetota bacterium]
MAQVVKNPAVRQLVPERHGCITDVPGLRLGHVTRVGRGWRTGTTVVLLPPGTIGGVDVRGGGPGTRETDLLHPTAMMNEVHAICLTGGSAFGLAAAGGVMAYLEERGVGFRVGPAENEVVPIVPAAVIFDLGRGGRFAGRPDEATGRRAAAAAHSTASANGAFGAGTGARSRGLQGGVGTASVTLAAASGAGVVVSALAVVNSSGSAIDEATGLPWVAGDIRLRGPSGADRSRLRAHLDTATPTLNTTIGLIATTAALTKAECSRMSTVAHDGLARAIRPVHLMFDGDTIFGIATGRDDLGLAAATPSEEPAQRARNSRLNLILAAAADCFAVACSNAITFAESNGGAPSYRDLCPSAFPSRGV